MTSLVQRQLKSVTDGAGRLDIQKLVQLVGAAYEDYERTIRLQDRATQLMSEELNEANNAIRRDRDETLAASQKRFELAVNGANDGIWDWSVADDAFWCSTRTRTMLDYPGEIEWTGGIAGWISHVDAGDKPKAEQFIRECIQTGATAPITIKFIDRGGVIRHFMCRATGVTNADGRVVRVVGIQTDVTSMALMHDDLRRAQQTAEVARAEAEKANAAKSEFLANMSHEIRTPLNGILGLTGLLAESPLDPDQQTSVHAILRSGETLMSLLNDILDFSKVEAGQLVLEEVPFNLDEHFRNVIALMTPLVAPKGISLQYDYMEGAPRHVIGDPTRINQIVVNLMSNARKFTEAGHIRLAVSAAAIDDATAMFRVLVEDTGIGMSAGMQNKVFTKFSQGDASTSRKYGGTGLGLAITKRLVEIMKGKIAFASREGVGTSFSVEIPMTLTGEGPARKDIVMSGAGAPLAQDFQNCRILVVDDHPVNRLFTTKLLAKLGVGHVQEAENGIEALRLMRSRPGGFDMVLMDCQMPEMDGFEATRRIREAETSDKRKPVPVIAMTAHAMEGDRDRCLRSGMDDYISKPIRRARLLSVMNSWLLRAEQGEAAAASASPEAAITLDGMLEYTNGDLDEERQLVSAFVETGAGCIRALREGLAGKPEETAWKHAAHKLKGAAAQLSAHALAASCLCAEVETGEIDRRLRCLREIENSFADLQAFYAARGTCPAGAIPLRPRRLRESA